ncbi:MAG TPA: IS1595 family transposase [Puia sp.]|nr:IS1595 family transposase [Puia sp.]
MIQITEFKSLIDLLKKFPDEKTCIEHLEAIRWEGNVVSPFDPVSKVYKCAGFKYKCKNTGKYFNVRTGTIFEDSKVPLQKWFMAIYIASSHKKGISSHQLAKDVEITQKSAWFLLHRIRYAFGHENFQKTFNDVVQADESFFGGKNRNRHADKRIEKSKGRAHKDKTAVLGLMEYGHVNLTVIPNTQAETIRTVVKSQVKKGAILVTDEYDAYGWLRGHCFHIKVNHTGGQYINGAFHTNSIEGFWSHIKRGIYGIYHQVSRKHLHRYCAEFAYRYNCRKFSDPSRFNLCLASIDKRLTYKELIAK